MINIRLDRDDYSRLRQIEAWCEERFGHGGYIPNTGDRWSMAQMFGYATFCFIHECDAEMFLLKHKPLSVWVDQQNGITT